jgi:tetratricopeptide (TPR) repeat protein
MTSRLQYMPALAAGLALLLLAVPATAQGPETAQERQYRACMQQTRLDPNVAFEEALRWQDLGGGTPAKHCAAVALSMLGHHAQAAERFEALASEMPDDAPAEAVADILAHAGLSWMQAGDLDRAYAVQSAALELQPDMATILVDRALVLAQQDRFWEAVDDLNRAIELDPADPAAYTLRASAYRFLEANDLAMTDVKRALDLDPEHPEALLERGILHRLAGDIDAARRDWLRLIELHDGRPAAEDARRNLELLDVNPDAQ